MSAPAEPRVTRTPRLPLIWIVPMIAIAVGGWMIVREMKNRGPEITIDFADGSGIEPGKSTLLHKGVPVGVVDAVDLRPDMGGVAVRLRLEKSAADLAREGAKFWIVHPEIGLTGVHGLDALITGAYLNVRPGKGPPAYTFTGLEGKPTPETPVQGRTFLLQTDRLGSLTAGAPVFYREFKVGAVETSRLSDDSTAVIVRIHLEAPYVDLVRTSTRFWNAGGFSFKVSLLGAEMKNTSLESLLTGGVAFATPDAEPLAPPAAEGALFKVAAESDKDWLKWAPRIPIKSPEGADEAPSRLEALSPVPKTAQK